MNNLILIGMMGAGKSTIGREISEKLGWKHLDTDKMIEEMQGMTIREIFDRYGESHFRSLESKLVEQLKSVKDAVISTGGGIILNHLNTMTLREVGLIVYLKAMPETLSANLDGYTKSRPLLDHQNIDVIYRVRNPLYTNSAELVIDIDSLDNQEIIDLISNHMKR
ncbi:MAG: shikimate kinase [Clostridia bacterium]|nr:shikimate kinase [Clostridia bacterium]